MSKKWKKKTKAYHDDELHTNEFEQAAAVSLSKTSAVWLDAGKFWVAGVGSEPMGPYDTESEALEVARTKAANDPNVNIVESPLGLDSLVTSHLTRTVLFQNAPPAVQAAIRSSPESGILEHNDHRYRWVQRRKSKAEWYDYARWAGRVAGLVALATGNPVPLILSLAGDTIEELYNQHLSPEAAARKVEGEVGSKNKAAAVDDGKGKTEVQIVSSGEPVTLTISFKGTGYEAVGYIHPGGSTVKVGRSGFTTREEAEQWARSRKSFTKSADEYVSLVEDRLGLEPEEVDEKLKVKKTVEKEMIGGAQIWQKGPNEWIVHDIRAGKDRGSFASRSEAIQAAASMGYKSVAKNGDRIRLIRSSTSQFAQTVRKGDSAIVNLNGRGVFAKVTKIQGTDAWIEDRGTKKSHYIPLGAILKGVEQEGTIGLVNELDGNVLVDLDDGTQTEVPSDSDAFVPAEVEGELLGPFEEESDAIQFAADLNEAVV